MDILRYGVFNLGQIWTLVCDDGVKLGFPSRESALHAAEMMADLHRSYGAETEFIVQDELGFVRVFPFCSEERGTRLPTGS